MSSDSSKSETKQSSSRRSTGGEHRFLAFALCNESYAVPLLKVREVIALGEITTVPYTASHFKGIMNLRGQVISVMDLRVKFKMQRADTTAETAIVILDLSPLCIGVIVDSVDAVLALSSEDIIPPPDLESTISSDYLTGVARVDKKLVLILDIEKTLSVDDLVTLKNQAAKRHAA